MWQTCHSSGQLDKCGGVAERRGPRTLDLLPANVKRKREEERKEQVMQGGKKKGERRGGAGDQGGGSGQRERERE